MKPIPNPEPAKAAHATHAAMHRSEEAREAREKAAAEAAPHPAPVVDHAKAARLRGQGLEELDRGRINRAVALLQAAHDLDPDNTLIQRDLDRAQRISRAVHARP